MSNQEDSNSVASLTITQPEVVLLLEIFSDTQPLVTIAQNGTVTVHHEGADREAAKRFYESLHIEGTTLYQKVESLRAERDALRKEVERLKGLSACEWMAEFPTAFEYGKHWEGRAETAERELAQLKAAYQNPPAGFIYGDPVRIAELAKVEAERDALREAIKSYGGNQAAAIMEIVALKRERDEARKALEQIATGTPRLSCDRKNA